MMDRRRLLLTSVAGALTRPLVAGAQQGTKVWRIGVLSTADGPEWNVFRQVCGLSAIRRVAAGRPGGARAPRPPAFRHQREYRPPLERADEPAREGCGLADRLHHRAAQQERPRTTGAVELDGTVCPARPRSERWHPDDPSEAPNLGTYVWHSDRDTFASRLVMAGLDVLTVKELGGWRSAAGSVS